MKTVYCIKGTIGDYEDRFEYVAKAFFNKERAKECLAQCQEESKRFGDFIIDEFRDKSINRYVGLDNNSSDEDYERVDMECNKLYEEKLAEIVTIDGTGFSNEYEQPFYFLTTIEVEEN